MMSLFTKARDRSFSTCSVHTVWFPISSRQAPVEAHPLPASLLPKTPWNSWGSFVL